MHRSKLDCTVAVCWCFARPEVSHGPSISLLLSENSYFHPSHLLHRKYLVYRLCAPDQGSIADEAPRASSFTPGTAVVVIHPGGGFRDR